MCHHWTPTGWVGVLGADWKFSWWEGRCGPDFLLESQARERGEESYFNQVRLLELIGDVLGEKPLDGMTGLPDAACFWRSLALMGKKRLSSQPQPAKDLTKPYVYNILTDRLTKTGRLEAPESFGDGTIIVPAACCSSPSQSTKNIVFADSFLGGKQVNCREGDSLEYTLSDIPAGHYAVTLRVCTVHLKQQPLLLTVSGDGDAAVNVATIVIPYTIGEWEYTNPVQVELSEGVNVLTLARETPNFGLTIKEIILTPMNK